MASGNIYIYEYPSLRYIYIEIEMNFIQFPDSMYPYTMYFSRMRYISHVNEPPHEEIELDWTLRFGMCSLRLVTDHEDKIHETDDKKKNARTSIFELACF